MSRRRAFVLAGVVGTSTLVACTTRASDTASSTSSSVSAGSTTATGDAAATCAEAAPQETAGPYPSDGSNGPNVLIESGIVRSDIRSSFGTSSGTAEGVPASITMTLKDLANECAAGAGMAVYLWHCNRAGEYSLYSEAIADQNYLRGVQVADANGLLSFTSIFPACYPGRWPHIHFEVFDSLESAVAGDNARLTSQLALPQEACETVFASDRGYADSVTNLAQVSLDSDNVFGDGWDAELATVTGDATGMSITMVIGVAEKSANNQAPSGPQPPGSDGQPSGQRPPGPPPN
ncbi:MULTISPECIES: dioxygenase [unclassified Mycobacterium]|uniref:dioxygenase family protein n=1 Tax=unclassified Mycobacterium TaxID=2642494 RepID=UPI0029C78F2D|nr:MULTISPECIES: dioxygenase [unclassified Mycobacterium]